MVENELSIKASETKRVAANMQDVQLRKVNSKLTKQLASLHQLINFKSKENEDKLHMLRLENLSNEIAMVLNDNPYDALETLYDNLSKELSLAWSFVKIDRVNLENEKVKSIIANHRHDIVKIDNAYQKAKLNKEEFDNNFNRDVNYHETYASYVEKLYKDTDARLEEKTFSEFIKDTKEEYAKRKKVFDEDFDKFYQEVEEVISKAYNGVSSFEKRHEVFKLASTLEENIKSIKELSFQIRENSVDLAILNEQEKEKLDVYDEKKKVISNLEELKTKVASLEASNKELEIRIRDLVEVINSKKNIGLHITETDETKKTVLLKIVNLFNDNNKDVSKEIFFVLRDYILSKLESYSTFYYSSYNAYLKANEEYRKQVASTLDEQTKSYYLKVDNYLVYLSGKNQSDVGQKIDELKDKNKLDKEKLEKEYKDTIKAIKDAKKARIAEYKKQKANAKVAMKVADAAKASSLKEVVKLYKKEIRTGEFNRYVEAYKDKKKKEDNLNASYNLELTKLTKADATFLSYEYDLQVKKDKKEYATKHKNQNRALRKENSISKYRKNMNVQSRENILGYAFLAVWAIGFLALTLVPILYTFILVGSDITYNANGYSKAIDIAGMFKGGKLFPNWVGWENFETLFLTDVDFLYNYIPRFFRNLLLFVPIVVFISFVLALLLNTKIKGRTLFRIIYFLPVVIVSGPILTLLNDTDNNKQSSIRLSLDGSSVATILQSLSPKLLQYANEVFQNFIIILWMTGVPIVLFISALQKINRSLYEAADIDGANGWQKLWTITFPLIKSVMLIVCLFTIMQVTTINYSGVNPINGWIEYNFSNYKFSITALGAWAQTIIVLIFVLLAFLLFREKEFISKQKSFEEMEAYKKKKQARQAKMYEFFHIGEIKNFFTKIFGPMIKAINVSKEKRRIKKEQGGK